MSNIFVLGPAIENVFEPFPSPPPDPVRRGIALEYPATEPGGIVRFRIAEAEPGVEIFPINVYAFFVQPVDSVPPVGQRTADWFFKSGAPSGSIHVSESNMSDGMSLAVAGVKPSLEPYFMQTILEYAF